jgi:hypothetical protein
MLSAMPYNTKAERNDMLNPLSDFDVAANKRTVSVLSSWDSLLSQSSGWS